MGTGSCLKHPDHALDGIYRPRPLPKALERTARSVTALPLPCRLLPPPRRLLWGRGSPPPCCLPVSPYPRQRREEVASWPHSRRDEEFGDRVRCPLKGVAGWRKFPLATLSEANPCPALAPPRGTNPAGLLPGWRLLHDQPPGEPSLKAAEPPSFSPALPLLYPLFPSPPLGFLHPPALCAC